LPFTVNDILAVGAALIETNGTGCKYESPTAGLNPASFKPLLKYAIVFSSPIEAGARPSNSSEESIFTDSAKGARVKFLDT